MRRIILTSAVFFTAVFLSSAQNLSEGAIFRQEGIASWYGVEFAGRPTSSGEIFNPGLLTAAHPALPFGTLLRVTNTQNNKQVIVRVNDRGPHVPSRIIDVSQAAAEQLDMISTGTAPVVVESLAPLTGTVGSSAQSSPNPGPLGQSAPYQPASSSRSTPTSVPAPAATVPVGPPSAAQAGPAAAPVPVVPPAQTGSVAAPVPVGPPAAPAQAGPVAAPVPVGPPSASAQAGSVAAPVPVVPPSASAQAGSVAAPVPVGPPAAPAQAGSVAAAPFPARPVSAPQNPRTPVSAVVLPSIPPTGTGKQYRVQVGAFRVARYAAEAFDKLKNMGLSPAYERYEENYRVVIPGIKPEEIPALAERLGTAGFPEILVREER